MAPCASKHWLSNLPAICRARSKCAPLRMWQVPHCGYKSACGRERGGIDGARPTHLTRRSTEVWLCEDWIIQPDASCIFYKNAPFDCAAAACSAFSLSRIIASINFSLCLFFSFSFFFTVACLSGLEVVGVTLKPSRTLRWTPRSPRRSILRGKRDRRTMGGTWTVHWPGTATNVDRLHQKLTLARPLKAL